MPYTPRVRAMSASENSGVMSVMRTGEPARSSKRSSGLRLASLRRCLWEGTAVIESNNTTLREFPNWIRNADIIGENKESPSGR